MKTGLRAVMCAGLAALASASVSNAADLHFFFMADTLDPDIGTGVDLQKAGRWAQTIASYTGLELRFESLSGTRFTAARARTMLQAINPGPDDVVYVTYSGHGFNTGQTQWPTFTLMTGSHLDFVDVVSILQPKPQRLLILLADCCNVPLASGRTGPDLDSPNESALTAVNFQNLFLTFRGTILVSASSQGEYSLGDAVEGGLFLNAFMEDLLEMAGAVPSLKWEDVLATTAADVQELASLFLSPDEQQRPQYKVTIEQVAAEVPPPPPPPEPPQQPTSAPSDDTPTSNGTVPAVEEPQGVDDPTDSAAQDGQTSIVDPDDGEQDADLQMLQETVPPQCGSMATLPLTITFCLWVLRRRPARD
ncbi:MAG TPA: caspase family protein [Phycisphaerae bacterium]|nr:caspase family protein [Phycisphaerae bacterium]HPU28247.1 caspase family protein [Phycisphaerae bacterium]HQE27478.1 caspase family protein [Phycisphaerae bacterium]